MSDAVKQFLGEDTKNSKNNEKTVLKSKLMSIVASLDAMEEERENIKEIVTALKNDHGIEPKVSKAVAKILQKPEKLEEMKEHKEAVQALYDKLSS